MGIYYRNRLYHLLDNYSEKNPAPKLVIQTKSNTKPSSIFIPILPTLGKCEVFENLLVP